MDKVMDKVRDEVRDEVWEVGTPFGVWSRPLVPRPDFVGDS